MNWLTKSAIILGISIGATISAQATSYTIGESVTVKETGVSPNEVVTIHSSTLGQQTVYAGITQLLIDGVATNSICVDPYQWASSSTESYTVLALDSVPSPAMSSAAAETVSKLWAMYFQQALSSNSTAAGLQIAVWETVAGGNFYMISGNDYGASGMITAANSSSIEANLVAVSSPSYQDYVVQNVPDAGATLVLLGLGLVAMTVVGRKARPVAVTID